MKMNTLMAMEVVVGMLKLFARAAGIENSDDLVITTIEATIYSQRNVKYALRIDNAYCALGGSILEKLPEEEEDGQQYFL